MFESALYSMWQILKTRGQGPWRSAWSVCTFFVLLYSQVFSSYRPFWDARWMTPKWPWTLKGQRYAIHMTYCTTIPEPLTPKFQSVSLYDQSFQIQAMRQVHWTVNMLNDPKMTLNTKRSKVPHIHMTINYPRPPYFTSFCFTASWLFFELPTSHFQTSALNDPKMTLNTERSKVPHTHVTTTPELQI